MKTFKFDCFSRYCRKVGLWILLGHLFAYVSCMSRSNEEQQVVWDSEEPSQEQLVASDDALNEPDQLNTTSSPPLTYTYADNYPDNQPCMSHDVDDQMTQMPEHGFTQDSSNVNNPSLAYYAPDNQIYFPQLESDSSLLSNESSWLSWTEPQGTPEQNPSYPIYSQNDSETPSFSTQAPMEPSYTDVVGDPSYVDGSERKFWIYAQDVSQSYVDEQPNGPYVGYQDLDFSNSPHVGVEIREGGVYSPSQNYSSDQTNYALIDPNTPLNSPEGFYYDDSAHPHENQIYFSSSEDANAFTAGYDAPNKETQNGYFYYSDPNGIEMETSESPYTGGHPIINESHFDGSHSSQLSLYKELPSSQSEIAQLENDLTPNQAQKLVIPPSLLSPQPPAIAPAPATPNAVEPSVTPNVNESRAVPNAEESRAIPTVEEPRATPIERPASTATPPSPPANNAIPPSLTPSNATKAPSDVTVRPTTQADRQGTQEISINFNNVSMVEYVRFISRISGRNFIFDEQDLQFAVTIVSEEPTSIDNLMAALLQELKIRDLSLIEQGNNIIIHRNPRVRSPGQIVAEGIENERAGQAEVITRVFRLNTLDPMKASEIIRPLLSEDALIEVLRDSNNLIITDLVTNINKIAQLIGSLDAPNSGMTIGQYVARNAFVDSLALLAERILQPIAQGNPFVLVPHPSSNSVFVISNPFLVEKALGILEHLDINEGKTRVFNLEKLRFTGNVPSGPPTPPIPVPGAEGLGPDGRPLRPGEGLAPGGISSVPRWAQELPAGHIERTLFFIHKLRYRRGDQIEIALRRIADSLQLTGTTNADLIAAINSVQWLESSNSLIVTGITSALDKVKELIDEIDVPLRQVFIEMLILDATIADSLQYGVDWGTRFGGGGTAGAQAFIQDGSPIVTALDRTGFVTASTVANSLIGPVPDPSPLARIGGFHLGIIGRHLTHNGTLFSTISALVRAVHEDTKANIVMNPKIITEDNNPAEIFVGSTTRYKTQSISNDQGNVITNNFQFLDVGTTLRVTPLIGNNDVITLEIIEEITTTTPEANTTSANTNVVDVNLVPVLSKNRTTTKVHVPNGFFIVLSGMIQNTQTRTRSQIPCLGGIPIIGAISKQKANREDKRNLMIFIRPMIVDTEEELENLTRREQDIYREKNKQRRSWNYEIDEALDLFSIKPTDIDDIDCQLK